MATRLSCNDTQHQESDAKFSDHFVRRWDAEDWKEQIAVTVTADTQSLYTRFADSVFVDVQHKEVSCRFVQKYCHFLY